jgi:guanine deaminase
MATSLSSVKAIYVGTFIHCKTLGELQIFHNAILCVDESGKIIRIEEDQDGIYLAQLTRTPGWEKCTVVKAKEGQFFFPGFIGEVSRSPSSEPANLPSMKT